MTIQLMTTSIEYFNLQMNMVLERLIVNNSFLFACALFEYLYTVVPCVGHNHPVIRVYVYAFWSAKLTVTFAFRTTWIRGGASWRYDFS